MELVSTIPVQNKRKLEAALTDADNQLQTADVSATDVYLRRVDILIKLNRARDAFETLGKILELDPSNAKAHWLVSCLERNPDPVRLTQLMDILSVQAKSVSATAAADTSLDDAYRLYALGRSLEQLGSYDRAFECFGAGAASMQQHLKGAEPCYDDDLSPSFAENVQNILTPGWFEQKPQGLLGKGPIFLVGSAGAGLGYVEEMLASHPDIHAGGALPHFAEQVNRLVLEDPQAPLRSDIIRRASLSDMHDLGVNYMISSRNARGERPYFVDKQSRNFLYLPFIAAALPDASIIHVKRCPIDACLSDYKWLYAAGHQYSYDLGALAAYYSQYTRLMDHYRGLLGDRLLDVEFETLVTDPDGTFPQLFDHIGVDAVSLNRPGEGRTISDKYFALRDEPPCRREAGFWRHYADHIGPLIDGLEANGIPVKMTV